MGKPGRAALLGRRKPQALDVCERHRSEHPNRCEQLIYEAHGMEAKALRNNEICRGCRLPLARVLDRISEVRKGACSFCYRTKQTVAVAREGFGGVHMEICEDCASDAVAALRKERGAEDDEDLVEPDDGE